MKKLVVLIVGLMTLIPIHSQEFKQIKESSMEDEICLYTAFVKFEMLDTNRIGSKIWEFYDNMIGYLNSNHPVIPFAADDTERGISESLIVSYIHINQGRLSDEKSKLKIDSYKPDRKDRNKEYYRIQSNLYYFNEIWKYYRETKKNLSNQVTEEGEVIVLSDWDLVSMDDKTYSVVDKISGITWNVSESGFELDSVTLEGYISTFKNKLK
jgi:hypothetical protein